MADLLGVYEAVASITKALAVDGIAKNRSNQQQGFKFRGIDDVYNALAGLLAEHQLCILPRVVSREVTERTTKSGGVLFSVSLGVEFDLVSARDGSRHTVLLYGEAMDSGDKATNKAMSAAYKYMALEVFCIPTEGDNDADSATHELAPRQSSPVANKLPGDAKKWDGHGGKHLSDSTIPVKVLASVAKWLSEKDAVKNRELVEAITAELEQRRAADGSVA